MVTITDWKIGSSAGVTEMVLLLWPSASVAGAPVTVKIA